MPIYVYDCMQCGVRSETLRRMSAINDPFSCPECDSQDTKRAVTAAAIHLPSDGTFRGSGRTEMDKRIGASAEQKREMYRQQQDIRDDVRKTTGKIALGRKADGTYAPIPEKRLQSRKRMHEKFEYAKRTGIKVVHDS